MSTPTTRRPVSETLEIDLGNGITARIEVRIFEEPLPTPLEVPTVRPPFAREIDAIGAALVDRRHRFPEP